MNNREVLLVSIVDAAKSLGVCRNSVYKMLETGQIETVQIGRRRLVKVASLRRIAEQGAA